MKVAFVGTHNSGKTTAIWYAASMMKIYRCKSLNIVEENARQNPYGVGEGASFISQTWMVTDQIQREAHAQLFHELVLCDRSVFDPVAYSIALGFDDDEVNFLLETALAWSKISPYDAVLYFAPLSLQPEKLRNEDVQFQLRVDGILYRLLKGLADRKNSGVKKLFVVRSDDFERCREAFRIVEGIKHEKY